MENKPSLSFSSLDTYDLCPYRYHRTYIRHERESANKHLLYGSAFHELLDTIYKENNFTSLFAFQNWPAILDKEILKKKYDKISQKDFMEVESNGRRDINVFFDLATRENILRPAIHHELEISGNYRNHSLKAKIDLVTDIRGGVGILDWKTGNPSRKVLMQLALYATLYWKKTGQQVDWICPVYIKNNQMGYHPFDKDMQEEAGEYFHRIYEKLIKDTDFFPKRNNFCKMCMYYKNNTCPIKH